MNSTKENLSNSIMYELRDENEIFLNSALRYILDAKNSTRLKDLTKTKKEDLYDEFTTEKLVDKSLGTKKDYKSVILDGFLARLYPNISKENILKYKQSKESIWSNATKCRNYGLIKNLLKFLYEARYLEEDLSKTIKIPRKVEKKQYCPTDEDMTIFFQAMRNIYKNEKDLLRYDTLFRCYAKTGFRKTELISIEVKDIYFIKESIYLKKTKNKDEVYFPMDEELKNIIEIYTKKLNVMEGPLFIGKGGKQIQTSVIHKVFFKIKEEGDLPKNFTIHGFRRYFAASKSNKIPDSMVTKIP